MTDLRELARAPTPERMSYDEAEKLALRAIYDTDGRGMIGRGRNHLHQRVARAIQAAASPAAIIALCDRVKELEGALEPFAALARAITDEGSPDYRHWLTEAKDWAVIFAFAGHSITLGQLRALASQEKSDG